MLEFKEIHVLDKNSEFFGTPTVELMENAGRGAFEEMKERFDLTGKNVCILAGKGNNGGDGVVLARYLSEICHVTVVLAYPMERGSKLSRINYKKLPDMVKLQVTPEIDDLIMMYINSDFIIDALLGIGVTSEPREPIKSMVRSILVPQANGLVGKKATIISLDIATGIGTSTFVKPDLTITFHDEKIGMTPENSGKVVIRDIGIPEKARTHVGPGEFVYYSKNQPVSHKGENGVVMVVGGGPYVGAPVLASLASLRSGADLVHLFVPRGIYIQASSFSPELIVHPMGAEGADHLDTDMVQGCLEFSRKCDAAVIGPGLGHHRDTREAVSRFVRKAELPMAIDADGIHALKESSSNIRQKEIILTPHLGEFRELFDISSLPHDPVELSDIVLQRGRDIGTTILLKSRVDIISHGSEFRFNETGHPAMTTGGTGDVLSGIVGALLARGMKPFMAGRLGAFICGTAGRDAAREKSFGLMASDVIEKIPQVLLKHIK